MVFALTIQQTRILSTKFLKFKPEILGIVSLIRVQSLIVASAANSSGGYFADIRAALGGLTIFHVL
jgi:hypothetical protein